MSTAAVASFVPPTVDRHISPRQYPTIVAATTSASTTGEREPASKRIRSNASPPSPDKHAIVDRSASREKVSPTSVSASAAPVIKVKKEPGSPSMSSRPRPKRLDLSSATSDSRAPPSAAQTSRPSAPLTSRESAGLQVQDMGLACLSPGFQTNDPTMREQLQRSLDVRDQQRQIIEARQKGAKPGSAHESDNPSRTQDSTLFGVQARTPTTSRRKGPPPGLSIAAPSAAQFANDRVIQSAPLNQTFTGLRPGDQAYSRHVQHGPSALSQTSHMHHVPAVQTNNRLPPIADVFANDRLDVQRNLPPTTHSPSNIAPAAPSPGFRPTSQQQNQPSLSSRAREFRSAEEAVAGLSGGRDDLMPKVVHYGGVQPPTPPSPLPHNGPPYQQSYTTSGAPQSGPHSNSYSSESGSRHDILARTSSMNGRRRGRAEFERDNGSPPSALPPRGAESKRTSFAFRGDDTAAAEEDWMAGMTSAEKKEEFLRLCDRAWDLFHSR